MNLQNPHLIILIVLVVVVVGGMWYVRSADTTVSLDTQTPQTAIAPETPNPNTDIKVSTNAFSYSENQPVSITLENMTTRVKDIVTPFFFVERFADGRWVEMKRITCPCGAECKEAPYYRLEAGANETYSWEQSEQWCEYDQIGGERSSKASSGSYRVRAVIAEKDEAHSGKELTYFSSVFMLE